MWLHGLHAEAPDTLQWACRFGAGWFGMPSMIRLRPFQP
jgi:hypothetical protein